MRNPELEDADRTERPETDRLPPDANARKGGDLPPAESLRLPMRHPELDDDDSTRLHDGDNARTNGDLPPAESLLLPI